MPTRSVLFLVALGLMLTTGCGPAKLKLDKTYTLDTGEAQGLDLQEIASPQTITVDFTSSAGEVSVYLFNATDAKGEDGLLGADSKKALGQSKGKEGNFEVKVPEKTATRIVVRGAQQKTTVTMKVTNAK